jgi:hypothetical protein
LRYLGQTLDEGAAGTIDWVKRSKLNRRTVSIFVSEIVAEGIVFAADKNITWTYADRDGEPVASVQDVGAKVLRWPRQKALLGYVGRAEAGARPMHDWLYDFMGDHIDFVDPATVANDLRDRLQPEIGGPNQPASIVQFAAFARREGHIVPEYWHITNVHGLDERGDYLPASADFIAEEQMFKPSPNGTAAPSAIRNLLRRAATDFRPMWFHQGWDLAIFNTCSEAVRQAFAALHRAGRLTPPQSLQDWERHCRMWVLMYGAYFEAFGEPGQRYVGGGADVLSIPWPDDL